MAEAVIQSEEIKSLLLPWRSNLEKSLGCRTVLLFQERLCGDPFMIEARFFHLMRVDVLVEDEEVFHLLVNRVFFCLPSSLSPSMIVSYRLMDVYWASVSSAWQTFIIYHPDLVVAIHANVCGVRKNHGNLFVRDSGV